MKNLTILLFLLLVSLNKGFAQEKIEFTCPNGKYKFHHAINRGTVLHIRCKHHKGGNLFFLLENANDKTGILLNPEPLENGRPKMKIRSVGPEFFVVQVVGKPHVYKFNWNANTWTRLEKIQTGQSSSQRE
jgi:hypothetical protein